MIYRTIDAFGQAWQIDTAWGPKRWSRQIKPAA